MILPCYSIGSNTDRIETELTAEFQQVFQPVFIAKPDIHLCPVIFSEAMEKIALCPWGINYKPNEPAPWFRSEGIIKKPHSRILIRKQRCLIPANGFFIRTSRDYFFVYPSDNSLITFGGVWMEYKGENRHLERKFSILTVSSSSNLLKISGRMPLIIQSSYRRKFLNKNKPLMEISRIINKVSDMDFSLRKISSDIFRKKEVTKQDFRYSSIHSEKQNPFPEKAILGGYYYFQSR